MILLLTRGMVWRSHQVLTFPYGEQKDWEKKIEVEAQK
jgi:hypothetical protein